MQIVSKNNLIPFNSVINNDKDNLTKRKIKKIYKDYNNKMNSLT